MEQNNFEELESVELVEDKVVENKKELKEYEKLLIAEANRCDFEKAVNLVKFGCFLQKEEKEIDFTKLELIPSNKKFKGLYKLYRSLETMDLIFICPLVENNKGDKEEDKSMKPYAYDCIYLESMDSETYELVKKSAKNNINNKVKTLYIASFVAYFTLLAITLIGLICCCILYAEGGFLQFLPNAMIVIGAILSGCVIALPLLVLAAIKYRSYKEQ